MILSRSAGNAFYQEKVGGTPLDHLPDLSFTEAAHGAKVINAGGEDLSWYRLAIWLRKIDLLSRPKDSALPGLYIG
jgi:hypothetical protein